MTETDQLIDRLKVLSHYAKKLADSICYNDSPCSADVVYGDCIERARDECILAAKKIEQLRAERDEARLEVCNFDNTRFAARQEATKRGWDCYKKEETP